MYNSIYQVQIRLLPRHRDSLHHLLCRHLRHHGSHSGGAQQQTHENGSGKARRRWQPWISKKYER